VFFVLTQVHELVPHRRSTTCVGTLLPPGLDEDRTREGSRELVPLLETRGRLGDDLNAKLLDLLLGKEIRLLGVGGDLTLLRHFLRSQGELLVVKVLRDSVLVDRRPLHPHRVQGLASRQREDDAKEERESE